MNGYTLHPPIVALKDTDVRPNNGQMSIRNKILSPVVIKDWLIIYTDKRPSDTQDYENFMDLLRESSKALGIRVENPGVCYSDGSLDSFINKIRNDFEKNGKPLIVVTFLANHEAKYYSRLKQLMYN